MEDGRTGLEQARRCLEAIAGQDFDTQRSLWKAALRFHKRDFERLDGSRDDTAAVRVV